jgi:plasmid stabilization system protein ParE
MAQVEWSNQALRDVAAICAFIEVDSPTYASLFAVDVFKAVERLTSFPKSGRAVPEYGISNIREIILGNYRIIYRETAKLVSIITVYHSARLLPEQI